MFFTLFGLLTISAAPHYLWLITGASVLGMGSSIFHPESARVARKASGGRFGMAQSMFQVGGNAGQACGPLLIAAIVMPRGQYSLSWLAVLPLTAMALLLWIRKNETGLQNVANKSAASFSPMSRRMIFRVFAVLVVLVFSREFYIASVNNYLIFYLTHKFGISVQAAQMRLFLFMFAIASGTLLGGPLSDRIGRRYVISYSILGAAPFTLAIPFLDLIWTTVVFIVIGLVLSSAFSSIVVFAQELVPGHIGTVAGLFFGLSFGMGGIGAAVLGKAADIYGIEAIFSMCSFLPLLGFLAVFLPSDRRIQKDGANTAEE
jgi:FSR family fosmidomycin resistance protein-like MFS transporter